MEAQERAENGAVDAWKKMASDAGTAASASQSAVNQIVQENLGGRGLGGAELEGDVSMRGAKLVKRAPASVRGKGKEKAVDEERVIMHCDFDSFFVSAGLVDRPHLRGKPVVVCHSQGGTGGGSSTSEIASASYEARKFGIKGGMRCVWCCQIGCLAHQCTSQPAASAQIVSHSPDDAIRIRTVSTYRLLPWHFLDI